MSLLLESFVFQKNVNHFLKSDFVNFVSAYKMDINTAVFVKDAVKSYGSKEVLKKFNMKVPKGVM